MQSVDQTGFTVKYTYDAAGRLSKLTDAGGTLIVQYTYDAAGNLSQKDNGNGTRTVYSHDAAGDLLSITNYAADHTTVNSSDVYTYDTLGNALTDTNQDGEWVYTYDADGELTQAVFALNNSNPDGLTAQDLQYVYDAAGNRISETVNGVTTTYVTNNVNEYTSSTTAGAGTTQYQYDLDGNLIAMTDPGNNTTNYTFDDLNQLTAVSGPGNSASYFYDPLGNRVSQTISGLTTNFQIDPIGLGNVVAAFSGTGVYNNSGGLLAHYTYGLGLVSQVGAPGTASYYDFGQSGNTIGMTNAAGSYVNRYSYSPFGQTTTASASLANPFTYAGQFGVTTDGSGLQLMRFRFYDPTTGDFLSRDPLGLAGGDENLRRYVGNNPGLFVDPVGTHIFDPQFIANIIESGQNVKGYYESLLASDQRSFDAAAQAYRAANLPGPGFEQNRINSPFLIDLLRDRVGAPKVNLAKFAKFAKFGKFVRFAGFLGVLSTVYDAYQAEELAYQISLHPPKFHPENLRRFVITAIIKLLNSSDPNNLVGPGGFGAENFISQQPRDLPYSIEFENDPKKANTAALDVTVTTQLDTTLDWSTFQLSSIEVGAMTIPVPDGLQAYSTTYDTTNIDGTPLQVNVSASLNRQTGLVTWTFRSIDPATGLAPDDPVAGFLRVDDSTGRGGHSSTTPSSRRQTWPPAQRSTPRPPSCSTATPLSTPTRRPTPLTLVILPAASPLYRPHKPRHPFPSPGPAPTMPLAPESPRTTYSFPRTAAPSRRCSCPRPSRRRLTPA